MEIFNKAEKVLSIESFDRKRFLAAKTLFNKAKGEEKRMIGQLMESQVAMVDNLDDMVWLNNIDDYPKSS